MSRDTRLSDRPTLTKRGLIAAIILRAAAQAERDTDDQGDTE